MTSNQTNAKHVLKLMMMLMMMMMKKKIVALIFPGV